MADIYTLILSIIYIVEKKDKFQLIGSKMFQDQNATYFSMLVNRARRRGFTPT